MKFAYGITVNDETRAVDTYWREFNRLPDNIFAIEMQSAWEEFMAREAKRLLTAEQVTLNEAKKVYDWGVKSTVHAFEHLQPGVTLSHSFIPAFSHGTLKVTFWIMKIDA